MTATQARSARFVGSRRSFGTLSPRCSDTARGPPAWRRPEQHAGSRARRLDVGEAVADAPDGHDRPGAVLGELAPQPAGVRVDRPGAPLRPEAPDIAQQLVLGEHAPRVAG